MAAEYHVVACQRVPLLVNKHKPARRPVANWPASESVTHHAARVAGVRVKRTPLTTRSHTRPIRGEIKRE